MVHIDCSATLVILKWACIMVLGRESVCSLSEKRVRRGLMKTLEMMKVMAETDLEFLVQGKKITLSVTWSITLLLHHKCCYTLKNWCDSSLLIRYRIK